jgi:hypothetical protein
MNDLPIKTALVIVAALAAVWRSKPAEARQPPAAAPSAPGGITHVNPHFRISLPPGWKVAASRPEPTEMLGAYSDGVIALEAVGPDGYFLDVWFECPGTEMFPDSDWKAVADGTGRRVDHFVERDASCTQESAKECVKRSMDPKALEPGPEYCHCSIGDGRLDIWASFEGKHPFRGSNGMCFHFGNASREAAERALLRDILRTFHLEGAVDAPEPPLPLPRAMQKALEESARKAREAEEQPLNER